VDVCREPGDGCHEPVDVCHGPGDERHGPGDEHRALDRDECLDCMHLGNVGHA
jgi:hypothetical protein